jgi:hypothetical protein
MDLPEIEGVDYTNSYMEFTLSGTGSANSTDPYDPNDKNEAGTYYGFTCYVTSIEMADTITAVFHYTENGTEKTITQNYSVAQYIADFDAVSSNFSATTIAAVHSLADLGHYVQPVLAAENHWSLGTDHAEMAAYHTGGYDSSEVNTVQNSVENYAIVRDTNGSKIAAVTYRLQLDSSTTVSLYLRPESGYEGSVVAYLDGGTSNVAVQQADGRYRIQIIDISAHELGYQHNIRVVADKEFTITVYALSYIQTVLNSSTYANNADMINAMVSLYKYYDAVMAYRQQ